MMLDFDTFDATIRSKTNRKREIRGLKRITKPQMKRAYKRLTEDPEVAKMSEDRQINYFVGYFQVA